MQEWLDQYFALIFPFFFIGMWILVCYWIALTGGWRLLAKRFSTQGAFLGEKWSMQSARMRWLTNYNNVLTIGAGHRRIVYRAPLSVSCRASASLHTMG